MKLSVIIPTYNEEKEIEGCLQSLLQQSIPRSEYEIIVADATSTDNTVAIAQRYADIVVCTLQRGIAVGRNLGARRASGDILLFLDADVHLTKTFLAECKKAFEDNSLVALCGKFVPRDGGFLPKVVYYGTYALVRFFSFMRLPLYPGICVAYRRSAFECVNGFREDLGISEDIDLSRRVSKIGKCSVHSHAVAYVATRRVQKHLFSTVVFHIWNDLRYLLTGRSAKMYPKTEEVTSWKDIWKIQRKEST